MKMLANRFVHFAVLLMVLVALTLLSGSNASWLKRLQYSAFDNYNRMKPRVSQNAVTVVDIDEKSLADLGQWPWPRSVLADLVAKTTAAGAKTIAFDIVFAESDRTSPSHFSASLPNDPALAGLRGQLAALPDNDGLFAAAIKNSGRAVTGFVWADKGATSRAAPYLPRGIMIEKTAAMDLAAHAPRRPDLIPNLAPLERAAAGNGSFSVSVDGDGIVRRVPMVVPYTAPALKSPRYYPSLAFEALRVAQGPRTGIMLRGLPQKTFADLFKPSLVARIGAYNVPLERDGQLWVHYAPRDLGRYVSASDVLRGDEAALARLKDKIVVVGTSAEGLKDIRSSPLDLFVPGIEMHVNIIEQALSGDFIARPALGAGVEGVFIFATGLAMIVLAPFISPVFLFGITAVLIGGAFGVSWWAYDMHGVLLDAVYPALAVTAMFILSALFSYLRSERERAGIRSAFGLYISPEYMAELTRHPESLQLGGAIRDLTVMFTDIRNFTTISEAMTPQQLINTMNDFLTPMSDVVMQTRGTIDKYMGDAMMAFWNAPLDDADHARHAAQAALDMQRVLEPVNARLEEEAKRDGRNFHRLSAGIGINTGPCAVGNMGSRQRFAYSALGDTVNLASRLEGQTKAYGVSILMGEETARQVTDFAMAELDLIRVKGKQLPVRIYTLLGKPDMRDAAFESHIVRHDAFLQAYRGGDMARAAVMLDELAGNGLLESYYTMMRARVAGFLDKTPPHGWDGVFVATEK